MINRYNRVRFCLICNLNQVDSRRLSSIRIVELTEAGDLNFSYVRNMSILSSVVLGTGLLITFDVYNT